MPLVPYQCAECREMATTRGRAKGLCKRCYRRMITRRWTAANRERERVRLAASYQKRKPKQLAKAKEDRRRTRDAIMEKLGNRCNCCGETEPVFLTIDHVQNDGHLVRKINRHHVYRTILAEGCPTDRYQILCWNCNSAKALAGICPHQTGSSRKT